MRTRALGIAWLAAGEVGTAHASFAAPRPDGDVGDEDRPQASGGIQVAVAATRWVELGGRTACPWRTGDVR